MGRHCSSIAKMAIDSVLQSHSEWVMICDMTSLVRVNVLDEVLLKWYLPSYSYDSLSLSLALGYELISGQFVLFIIMFQICEAMHLKFCVLIDTKE